MVLPLVGRVITAAIIVPPRLRRRRLVGNESRWEWGTVGSAGRAARVRQQGGLQTGRVLPNAARHGVGHDLPMCPIRIGHRVGTGGRALSLGMDGAHLAADRSVAREHACRVAVVECQTNKVIYCRERAEDGPTIGALVPRRARDVCTVAGGGGARVPAMEEGVMRCFAALEIETGSNML